jgi:hypothetical protein
VCGSTGPRSARAPAEAAQHDEAPPAVHQRVGALILIPQQLLVFYFVSWRINPAPLDVLAVWRAAPRLRLCRLPHLLHGSVRDSVLPTTTRAAVELMLKYYTHSFAPKASTLWRGYL